MALLLPLLVRLTALVHQLACYPPVRRTMLLPVLLQRPPFAAVARETNLLLRPPYPVTCTCNRRRDIRTAYSSGCARLIYLCHQRYCSFQCEIRLLHIKSPLLASRDCYPSKAGGHTSVYGRSALVVEATSQRTKFLFQRSRQLCHGQARIVELPRADLANPLRLCVRLPLPLLP